MDIIPMPSKKQLALITKIEKALGVKFEGKTSKSASDFISEHMTLYKEYQDNNYILSDKQKVLIKKLELELGIEFPDTKNKYEVQAWINEALAESKRRGGKNE